MHMKRNVSIKLVLSILFTTCTCACHPNGSDVDLFARSNAAASDRKQIDSLLGRPLYAAPPNADISALEADLVAARAHLAGNPDDPKRVIWVGRRLGYLWRMKEAIGVYSMGIAHHPNHAALYRHCGHRYISLRRFDEAIADLERAADLIRGRPDVIEQDGQPIAAGIPLTTLGFNIWYHLGVAKYLAGDFDGAVSAFKETMRYTRGLDDNIVAVTDWMYMALGRLGRQQEAKALLTTITPEMNIIENHAYHKRLLMYQQYHAGKAMLDAAEANGLDQATIAYGLGNWFLVGGHTNRARAFLEQATSGPYWPAFGFIAAEVDLARMWGVSAQP